jgi:hypothetical protein
MLSFHQAQEGSAVKLGAPESHVLTAAPPGGVRGEGSVDSITRHYTRAEKGAKSTHVTHCSSSSACPPRALLDGNAICNCNTKKR